MKIDWRGRVRKAKGVIARLKLMRHTESVLSESQARIDEHVNTRRVVSAPHRHSKSERAEIIRESFEARGLRVEGVDFSVGLDRPPVKLEFPELDRAVDDNFNLRFGLGYSGRYDHDSGSPWVNPTIN